ncbi:MAG: PAS domain-containing sensor histidine kinase [Candidatus Lokiarchaeota archaeon]|nr:PAS domain-containing sensor histidine kinase [Candidatus Lokiarchaeota archaeon]
MNKVFTDILRYSPEKIYSWEVDELLEQILHPEDFERISNLYRKTRAGFTNTLQNTQFRIKRKDGEIREINSFFKSISYNGAPAALNLFLDTTEIAKAEQTLEESEREFRNLYEDAPLAYFSVASDKSIQKCNKAAQDLLGYSEDNMLNMNVFDLYAKNKDGLERAKELFRKFLTGEEIRNQELQMKKENGDHIWVSLSVKPILNQEGIVIASRSIVLDIDERKKIEEKLRISQENLEKRVEERTNQFQKTNEYMNLFRSLFAHDINNIFSNIKMSSELCSLYIDDPSKLNEIKELLQVIEIQISRGGKLIKNVQQLSLFEGSQFPIEQENLEQILNASTEFLVSSFPNREIDINTHFMKEKIFVKANELLIDVFDNLLFNSVIHNNLPQVKINIVISRSEVEDTKFIKLEFKDNGIGILDERKKSIFQSEIILGKKERGMGLGLSLVKKIVDSYDGKIWVENRVKKDYKQGSNFIVLIPEAS